MDEFDAVLVLLWMLVTHPGTGPLMALLVLAAVIDWRSYRIPNWLTVTGAVYGLLFNAVHATSMAGGLATAAIGLFAGLLLMLPLYVIRVLGAGDVKLMAMVGASLGAVATLKAALLIFIVGGIAAIAFAVSHRAVGRLGANVRGIVESMVLPGIALWRPGRSGASVGRLPYGVSISAGTIAFLAARQLGFL